MSSKIIFNIARIYRFFFHHKKIGTLLRYLLIGGSCALGDMLLLYTFVEFFHIWYLYASIISWVITSILSFLGQKHFTFKNTSKKYQIQFPIFILVAIVGLGLNSLCLFFLVSILKIWYMFANIITKFIVLIWNFLAHKYITFKTKNPQNICLS